AQQKGSLVGPERFRFDFTHGAPLSAEQIAKIEDLANGATLQNAPVSTEVLSMDAAKERGAMMLFGEKYGEKVRVLSMGDSVELCGGTHARATGDIGLIKVVSEQGIAAGVRRVTATTGQGSLQYVREVEQTLSRASALTKAGNDLPARLEKMIANEKALEKQITDLQRKLASGGASGVDAQLGKAR